MPRIHVLGASGSGASTFGRALAARLGVGYFDSDDFLWLPTDPAFTTRRPDGDRGRMLDAALALDRDWVFAGSALGWGEAVEHRYDRVIFLRLDPVVRLERLRAREFARFGARIRPGGDMAAGHEEFIAWAAEYDRGTPDGRSLVAHEAWLAARALPLLRLDSRAPVEQLVAAASDWLAQAR